MAEKILVVKKWVVVNELGERIANHFANAHTEILEQKGKQSKVRLTNKDGAFIDLFVPTSQIVELPKI